ncbi:MAG: ATP-grasp domain-containing protein [Desulfurococcaceae archaeon]
MSSNSGLTILVTGAGGPAGVSTILLLRDFYRIVSTDINLYSEGFAVSHRYYIIPPAVKEESFVENLMEIVEREEVDLVIPTVDEEIEVLSRNTSLFGDKLVVHPRETVEICLNKYKTYEYFKNKIPEIIPEFSKNPKDISSELVVKKPVKSRGSRGVVTGSKEVFKEEDGFFFVEYLPGREWTVDVLTDRSGDEIVVVPRVRLKTRGGVSVVGEVKLNKSILYYTREIIKKIKFKGPLNIQFREDPVGFPKLQEINVRFSGGLEITAASGVNLPKILVEYWVYDRKPVEIHIEEGVYVVIPQTYKLM